MSTPPPPTHRQSLFLPNFLLLRTCSSASSTQSTTPREGYLAPSSLHTHDAAIFASTSAQTLFTLAGQSSSPPAPPSPSARPAFVPSSPPLSLVTASTIPVPGRRRRPFHPDSPDPHISTRSFTRCARAASENHPDPPSLASEASAVAGASDPASPAADPDDNVPALGRMILPALPLVLLTPLPMTTDDEDGAPRESAGMAGAAADCGPPRGEASLIARRRGEPSLIARRRGDEGGDVDADAVVLVLVLGQGVSCSDAVTAAARRASRAPIVATTPGGQGTSEVFHLT